MTANPLAHQHDYLDFDIEITAASDGGYEVRARSAAGETRRSMRFPFDRLALENRLLTLENALLRSGVQHRQALTPQQTAVQEFGRELFETLLAGTVRDLYVLSGQLAVQHRGLRLRLHVDPPELAALPWELLFDPDAQRYLSLDAHRPIVRFVDAVRPLRSLQVTAPLRILAMIASPKNLVPLQVERERQRLERAVAALRATQQVVLEWVQGETWRDLKRGLERDEWHMFHFIGHGAFDLQADEGYLALCDEAGDAAPFFASQFALLLSSTPTSVI